MVINVLCLLNIKVVMLLVISMWWLGDIRILVLGVFGFKVFVLIRIGCRFLLWFRFIEVNL